METSFGVNPHGASIGETVGRFYDIGSPLYLKIFGEHIHDGYYITGKESPAEAQEQLVKLLAGRAGIKKGDRVLDAGCGVGGSSVWLAANLGAVTTGITISPVQVQMARGLARRQGTNALFLLMDAESMDFPGTFDIIWAVDFLTHLKDQVRFLARAEEYLAPKGRFVIFDWMLPDGIGQDAYESKLVKAASEGMLFASLIERKAYLSWFQGRGYRVVYSEDSTESTLSTWDEAYSVLKRPATWLLAAPIAGREPRGLLTFLKGLRAMRLAMRGGELRSGIVIAERLSPHNEGSPSEQSC